MQHFDSAATRARLPYPELIAALQALFVHGCEVPARHVHAIGDAGTLLLMPAWRPGAMLGIKAVNVFPGNTAVGLPGVHASYTLFDAASGVPLATMDGSEITTRRTAAASALAASFLARADARRLLVIGAGRIAAELPAAMRAVRPGLDSVTVWNHRAAGADRLAATLRQAGWRAQATEDLAAAVADADIVSCATLASVPLVRGVWLRPGTHLDLIGSFAPSMREADGDCFAQATVCVDTPEALAKSGDLIDAIAEGKFATGALRATLAQLCRGEATGRSRDDERTLFKSVGTALEDLAAAELIWARR